MAKNRAKKNALRVMIVDDHPIVREGLSQRLENQVDMTVCAETGDFAQALTLAKKRRPDVAIVDLSLKTGHGLELIKRLKMRHPEVRILVCSTHPEALYAERVLQAGALGYVNKEDATDKIIEAIRRVRDDKVYLSAIMAERLRSQTASGPADGSPLSALSDRELETFEQLGK